MKYPLNPTRNRENVNKDMERITMEALKPNGKYVAIAKNNGINECKNIEYNRMESSIEEDIRTIRPILNGNSNLMELVALCIVTQQLNPATSNNSSNDKNK
ncbi:MAG: hypothetical protein QXI93_03420 [Candidatus Methanomethylicia archaeon]